MTNYYLHFFSSEPIERRQSLVMFVLLLLAGLSAKAQPGACPDPGGGRADHNFAQFQSQPVKIFPGEVPAPYTGREKGTVGYLYHDSDASVVYAENVVTLHPLLNGITGGVALRFEALSLTAPNAIIEIFQGLTPTGSPWISLTEANQNSYVGTSVSYNGPLTLRFSSTIPAPDETFDVDIRYMTGDQIVTSSFGHAVAVWTDFIQPDSYTPIDDFRLSTSNSLPISIGHFDSNRQFVGSEEAYCLIHERKQIGAATNSYPGQISFSVGSDLSDFDRFGSDPEVQKLKMARVTWILANATNVTRQDTEDLQMAIWTTMSENYDSWYGGLHSQAMTAIPSIPSPLPSGPSLVMTNSTTSALPGDNIDFLLNITGGTGPLRVKLNVPAGVTIAGVTGATHTGGYLEVPSSPATIQITATSPTEQSATLTAVLASITDYWNQDNFTYFIPCQRGSEEPFQDFLGFGSVKQLFLQTEASGTWTTSLPVSLVRFGVSREAGNNLLTWTTTAETHNRGFEIQRNTPVSEWESIGFVDSKAEDGTTQITSNYSFADGKPSSGINYYRLKQFDLDGTFTYSPIVSVKTNAPGFTIFPNPVTGGKLTVRNDNPSSIVNGIYNLTGKEMTVKMLDDNAIDVSGLSSGVYVLRLKETDGSYTSKTFVIK